MVHFILRLIFGDKTKRDLKRLEPFVKNVNALSSWAKSLSDEDFPRITQELKEEYTNGKTLDELLPQAFACIREAADRVLGERPYDVQIMGGVTLHQGRITEMKTGEGKTLTSVAPAYLNSLSGRGVHIVTVNDYLASRDAMWMRQIYSFVGLTVGCVTATMDAKRRNEEYSKDITYITNNELGFDYLRDNMSWSYDKKCQGTHAYCIIDEIDSILIDEARTPLIISGSVEEDLGKYRGANKIVQHLTECEKNSETGLYPRFDAFSKEQARGHFMLEEKNKRVTFTDEGMNEIEAFLTNYKLISGSLYEGDNFEMLHYVTQAMKAHYLFIKDVDYVIQNNKVEIVDEFTGRVLSGRRYSDGLHQAIEAKENIKIAQRSRTVATITFQNFFRLYDKVSGMTGTAATESREFGKIYGLDVVEIPTHKPQERIDKNDIIFLSEKRKVTVIAETVKELHAKGQPVLIGTVSVEKSEQLSTLFRKVKIPHEILNAKNHHREAHIIEQAGIKNAVTIATNMAGRGTDIKLGGNYKLWLENAVSDDTTPEEYSAIEKKLYEKWKADHEEVLSLGGLYVIGTERHESRRIDNQLRGRSGRQGDPGETQFYVSLDDDLMRLFGGENFKRRMIAMGMSEDEALNHRLISNALERAQKRVEDRNYDIRKHLLDFDDVLNRQRTYIYEIRDSILINEKLSSSILHISEEILDILFEDCANDLKLMDDKDAYSKLLLRLKETFSYENYNLEVDLVKELESFKKEVADWLKKDLANKENLIQASEFNQFIRFEYIRLIDSHWQDHLENLEALREAVYLRSYAQKNPLVEYKNEGFEIFQEMVDNTRVAIAKRIIRIRIAHNGLQHSHTNRTLENSEAIHKNVDEMQRSARPSRLGGENKGNRATQVQVRRSEPKVGRNEPCPCGSGKKYKHCHG